MKTKNLLLIYFTIWSLCMSCDDCDDCKDLQTKTVAVEDEFGNDLLFGSTAVYEPESITVTAGGQTQPVFVNPSVSAIEFSLAEGVTEYRINFDENTSDTLNFDLDERDSERCCGTQTFSTSTRLNGIEINNTRIINIVKPQE